MGLQIMLVRYLEIESTDDDQSDAYDVRGYVTRDDHDNGDHLFERTFGDVEFDRVELKLEGSLLLRLSSRHELDVKNIFSNSGNGRQEMLRIETSGRGDPDATIGIEQV